MKGEREETMGENRYAWKETKEKEIWAHVWKWKKKKITETKFWEITLSNLAIF